MMKRRGLLGALGAAGAVLGLSTTAQASTAIPLPPAPKQHRNGMTDRQIEALRDEVLKRVGRYDAWPMPEPPSEDLDMSLLHRPEAAQDRTLATWKTSNPQRWKKQSRLVAEIRRWAKKNESAWAKRIATTGLFKDEHSYLGPVAEHSYARGIAMLEAEGARPSLILIGPRRLSDLMPSTFEHYELCHPDALVRAWLWERPVVADVALENTIVFVGKKGSEFKLIRFSVYE